MTKNASAIAMTCKNICTNYKAIKQPHHSRYSEGQKRCIHCEIFIRWEGYMCPCCGYRLRSNPRSRRLREKLRDG